VADKPISAAAEIAREANAHILVMDARLHQLSVRALEPEEEPLLLFCECGCMGEASSTRIDYGRNGGAWLEGHSPD
jgi:hypothetical protein